MRIILAFHVFFLSLSAFSADKHESAFQHLASLSGKWQGNYPNGRIIEVEYELISGGYALLERWRMSPTHQSITIYTIDNGKLNLRHFCPQGNQVQLTLNEIASSAGQYVFEFVNATNTEAPDKSHLSNTNIAFISDQEFARVEDYKFNLKANSYDRGQRVVFTKINYPSVDD
ncbi:hypothetical protein [Alteromonas flava]|uniref:hypothetical protein n=1 Tax=Alteromonas flava TaxID=2048003 RepID=UPI000C282465|nr:hypothetical protein [Alteromonas flava]